MTIDTQYEQDKEFIEDSKVPYISPKRKLARQRAQSKGFFDEIEYSGWLYFQRLDNAMYEGYSVDVLHMNTSGDGAGSSDY
jgi:hypothetical protein